MKTITLDFETLFSKPDYSLSNMSTEAYVRDARFAPHLCGFRWHDGSYFWIPKPQLREFFASHDWSQYAVLMHHASFDALILSHHFSVKPGFIFDTYFLSKLLLGNHLPKGLDALAQHFDLNGKTIDYNSFMGKQWEEIAPPTQQALGDGCAHDCGITYRVFERLMALKPPIQELELIDWTVRCHSEPVLIGDVPLLVEVWEEEARANGTRLAALGITKKDVSSANKFAELLRTQGIEVETKPGKNDDIPAFAKTDEFMKGLLEHENPTIRALAEARIGAKATLLQTRSETLGHMANRGPMCLYYMYCGTHVLRWSGSDGANFQNLPRGHKIRRSLKAPEGYVFAAIDSEQIQCKIANYIAGQWDVIEEFKAGRSPYVKMAKAFYGYDITKKGNPLEYQVGKVLELQCQFGSGAKKIQSKLLQAEPPIRITNEEALRARDTYRRTHDCVVRAWDELGHNLGHIAGGSQIPWGPVEIRDRCVWLPNGCPLLMQTLEWWIDPDGGNKTGWRVKTRKGYDRLWGSKLFQNIVVALERVLIGQAILRIRRAGLIVPGMSHDEIWVMIPKGENEQTVLQFCLDEINRVPDWAPGLPLSADATIDVCYAK